MAPRTENQKLCSSKSEKDKIHDELLLKLKLEEEREKKKLEKEAKRRAELEKIKNESLAQQAVLLIPYQKEKTVETKTKVMKSQAKKKSGKKQPHNSQNQNNPRASYESNTSSSKLTSSAWNNQQFHNERRMRHPSSSSDYSWKREDGGRYCSSSYTSDSLWGDKDNHFPMLGAEAPVPQVNVWEERKMKQEEKKSLEPHNQYDEEAMLQRALALSMVEEQERQRKLEEECRLQMAALESNPEIFEELNVSEDFFVTELESHGVSKPTEDQYSKQNSFTNNSCFSQKDNLSNSAGVRPKLNKIIDSFGGWGLKGTTKSHSDKLSNFVDNVVSQKSPKNVDKFNTSPNYEENVYNKNAKKSEKNNDHIAVKSNYEENRYNKNTRKSKIIDDPWETSDTEIDKPVVSDSKSNTDVKKSSPVLDPWESEVVYDQKGTFTDIDLPGEEGPYEKLDKWLDSVDEFAKVSNGWDDVAISDKKQADIKPENPKIGSSIFNNNAKAKCENSNSFFPRSEDNSEDNSFVKDNISSPNKLNDHLNVSKRTFKLSNTSFDNHRDTEQNEFSHSVLSEFKSTYDYVVGNDNKYAANAVETTLNKDIWSDKSSSKSASSSSVTYYSNPPLTENVVIKNNNSTPIMPPQPATENLNSVSLDKESIPPPIMSYQPATESLSSISLDKESIPPPILPPQPASTIPVLGEVNQGFSAEGTGPESTENLASYSSPKNFPEMPSQYPMFNPTLFPGMNPLLGFGLDPMRQMLMLRNPFFASQLLAMEQYYRACCGIMPVDLCTLTAQTMPNMPFPGAMGALGQNISPNVANVNASLIQDSQLQNQFQCQNASLPINQDGNLSENILTKNSLDSENCNAANTSSKLENVSEDSWFSQFLSNDNASVIPPPKPLSHDSVSIPEPFQPNPSASIFNDNVNRNQNICNSLASNSAQVKDHEPAVAVEACLTKANISGWGDLDKNQSNANTWNDDGWGDDTLLTKSVKNQSTYDEKKKVVHRQPARQPQLSRFQSGRKY